MAEQLADYMAEIGVKASYLHSEVLTLERIEIIRNLRKGEIDVIIGVNLLREGLDIPECALVAILDADKEGFLRSETALIQTIGRAARNIDGKAILYADRITDSMARALKETERRRLVQLKYNEENKITPASIRKSISSAMSSIYEKDAPLVNIDSQLPELNGKKLEKHLEKLRKEMFAAAANLEFEKAAKIRDQLNQFQNNLLRIM